MKKPLIERIAIRAQDNFGKWGSFTLSELVDIKQGGKAFSWLIFRMCGYNEGDVITKQHLEELAKLLPEGTYVSLKE